MSVPIRVKLFKNGEQQIYPERFMTLSIGTGYDYREPKFYPNKVFEQVLDAITGPGPRGCDIIVPNFDIVQVKYGGWLLTKDMQSSLVKIEGDRPIGMEVIL